MRKAQRQSDSGQMKKPVNKPCRFLRKDLFDGVRRGFFVPLNTLFQKAGLNLDAEWVQKHIAVCPRCQRRFAKIARINLALSLMKSQPHKLNLLAKANTQTIQTLQRSLRQTVEAQQLKVYQPEPRFEDTWRSLRGSLAQMAACMALLVLSKIGTFTSIEKTQSLGQKAVQHYYAQGVGEDLTDELFKS